MPYFSRSLSNTSLHSLQPRELLCGERDSCCGGLPGHRRDLLELQAGDKHGGRRYPAPAEQLPTSTNEFRFRTEREIQDHLCRAAVELLRQLEERLLRPGLSVGRTPDRHVERFLFNLIRDGETAEKRARRAGGDVERSPIAIGFQASFVWNEIQCRRESAHRAGILTHSSRVCRRCCPVQSRPAANLFKHGALPNALQPQQAFLLSCKR